MPWKKNEYRFHEFNAVVVSREVKRSGKSRFTVFPVRLTGPGRTVGIHQPRIYNTSRSLAERIAKLMNIEYHDSSSGTRRCLMNRSRERVNRENIAVDLPKAPEGCRLTAQPEDDGARIVLPRTGFGIGNFILLGFSTSLFFGIFIGVLVLLQIKSNSDLDLWFLGIIFGLFIIGGIFISGFLLQKAIRSGTAHEEVTVSGRMLGLERISKYGSQSWEIPTDELEELFIGENQSGLSGSLKVIIARSDKATLQIGRGLNNEELQWLHDAIKFAVVS